MFTEIYPKTRVPQALLPAGLFFVPWSKTFHFSLRKTVHVPCNWSFPVPSVRDVGTGTVSPILLVNKFPKEYRVKYIIKKGEIIIANMIEIILLC